MRRPKIRFIQSFGTIAKIEGSAECAANGLRLELAMTESPEGRVKGVVKRELPYAKLEEVTLLRRFLRRSKLVFAARDLETFDAVPGAKGYEYVVTPVGASGEIRKFVTEVRLAIAQATLEAFTKQIEDPGS